MSPAFNFLLTSRQEPKVPHILVLNQNQRTGKFDWSYHTIIGKIKDPKAKASGNDVRYANGGRQYDLYANGSRYGTLTLTGKSINALVTGDTGVFNSFSGSIDDARFTNKS